MKSSFNKIAAGALAAAMTVSAAPTVIAADAPTTGKVLLSLDFEDGGIGTFGKRGDEDTTELSIAEDGGINGKYLLASGRSQSWNGPMINLAELLEPNTEYFISAKVKGKYYTNVTLSYQYDREDGDQTYMYLVKDINQQNFTLEDGWATIPPTKFSFTDEMKNYSVYFEGGTDDIFVDDFVISEVPDVEIEQDIPGLCDVFANDFKVGTAIVPSDLSSKPTMALVQKHYRGSLTAGNEMKPDAVLNQKACKAYFEETGDDSVPQISFSAAKPFLNYCRDNDIPVRIHTLVWHSQTPDWFFKEGYDKDAEWVSKEKMIERMENYIKAYFEELTALYPDIDFYACDVVNEAWTDQGEPRQPGEQGSNGSSKSAWVQVFGDNSFIEYAFTFAKKYAPKGCKLYYNDYNEYSDGKINAVSKMALDFKEKGIIDGIGLQSHLDVRQGNDAYPSINIYNRALDKYCELGLDIQITELDATTDYNPTEKAHQQQADYYKGIWDSIYAHKDSISAVVIWGVTDDKSWRFERDPLLFDGEYKAKPAFYSIIEGYEIPETTTTVSKTTQPTTATTVAPSSSSGVEPTMLGDANCDGKISIADATAILQSIVNPKKYGLSDIGSANADCCDPGDGVTTQDAYAIQLYDAGMVTEFPISNS